jgi:hypothetical protein
VASQLIRDAAKDHLLTPKNSAMLIIDYQPVQVNSIESVTAKVVKKGPSCFTHCSRPSTGADLTPDIGRSGTRAINP